VLLHSINWFVTDISVQYQFLLQDLEDGTDTLSWKNSDTVQQPQRVKTSTILWQKLKYYIY